MSAAPTTTATSRPANGVSRPRPPVPEITGPMQSLARRIQTLLSADQARGHVLGVTSCTPREGVSTVAANVAICAADLYRGRVLLVDANPRSTSVASRFGVQHKIGLVDCLAGEQAVQECIAGTAHSNLFVLPAGLGERRPARISDERARALFSNLQRDFDLIVVDFPPAGEMDAMIPASRLAAGFLLVVESEKVRRHVAQRVVQQLAQVDTRLLGVVLNKRKNHIPEWLYRRL